MHLEYRQPRKFRQPPTIYIYGIYAIIIDFMASNTSSFPHSLHFGLSSAYPNPLCRGVWRLQVHAGSVLAPEVPIGVGGGGGVNQAYSRQSTTYGHITDCKFDSVVYAGVCVVS